MAGQTIHNRVSKTAYKPYMLLRKELVNNGVGKMINLCTAMLLKSLYFLQSPTFLDRQTHLLHLLDLCHSLVCAGV